MDASNAVVALGPVIALMAYIGGVTQNHPRRRLALSIGAALSLLWITLVLALATGSS